MKRELSRFIIYSLIGIIMFFVPISLFDKHTILFDHFVGLFIQFPAWGSVYGLSLIVLCTVLPFIRGTWRETNTAWSFP